MAATLWWLSPELNDWIARPLAAQILLLSSLCVGAVLLYFALLLLFGVRLADFKAKSVAESRH